VERSDNRLAEKEKRKKFFATKNIIIEVSYNFAQEIPLFLL